MNSTRTVASTPSSWRSSSTALKRREEVDPVPERCSRMRVKRQDGRLRPRGERRFDHQPMAQVDAVERPERDDARDGLEPIDARVTFISRARRGRRRRDDPLGIGIRDVEGPDVGASQAHAMAAERFRHRAHVPARAEAHGEARDRLLVVDELELVDGCLPRRHLDGDALPVELVRALAADLDRRGSGDLQVDLAAEAFEQPRELGLRRRSVLLDDVPFGIARRGQPRKVDRGLVALREADEALGLLRDDPSRTSRSPVANGSSVPAWPARAPVLSRMSRTIANDEGPAGLSKRTSPLGSVAPLRAISRGRELAANELGDLLDRVVAGEAGRLAVPPPPEARAIFETSISSADARRLTRLAGASPRGGSRISAAMSAPSTARR